MRRNMELIREIALFIESKEPGAIPSDKIDIEDYTKEEIAYHCGLMFEQGLFKGQENHMRGDPFPEYMVERLTVLGHDFVDSARDDRVWKPVVKKMTEAVGGATLSTLIELLKLEVRSRLGMG